MNQQPPVPVQHVCFSGSPSCSGCNPCPECQAYVQEQVLPSAFLGSRMNETLLQLHNMIGVLLEKGVDPRQLGVDLSRVWPTLEEQADGFFMGYNEGWGRMHEGMRTNPTVRNRLHVRTVAPLKPDLPQWPGQTDDPAAITEPKAVTKEAPPQPAVDPWQEALRKQQEEWEAEEAQYAQDISLPAAQAVAVAPEPPKPVPLTVEEVASAGFPLPAGEHLRNGAA